MIKCKILVVDDDDCDRKGVSLFLKNKGHEVDCAASVTEARSFLEKNDYYIVITDLRIPDGEQGLDLLQVVKNKHSETIVIVMTGCASIDFAVKAIQMGASDFVEKPVKAKEFEVRLEKAIKDWQERINNKVQQNEISSNYELVGNSPAIQQLRQIIARVAPTDNRVLITGPHGSGKEVIARAIQTASQRSNRVFVMVNCAGLPESLLDAELFGAAKGSFSGSVARWVGKFQLADGGTLFLDEIGDVSILAQAKMLRALNKEGEVQTIGENSIPVDVRVITATNRDIPTLIREGKFREDLYYRINTIHIPVPALSDRKQDIPDLIQFFLQKKGKAIEDIFSEDAVLFLKSWHWPGNVRELVSFVDRILCFYDGKKLTAEDVKLHMILPIGNSLPKYDIRKKMDEARADFEREFISLVLADTQTDEEAAIRLGYNTRFLQQKIRELGVPRKR